MTTEHAGELRRLAGTVLYRPGCSCGWVGADAVAKPAAAELLAAHRDEPPTAAGVEGEVQSSTDPTRLELHMLLRRLRPEKRWPKRITTVDLCGFAVTELDQDSPNPDVQRALELAWSVYMRKFTGVARGAGPAE